MENLLQCCGKYIWLFYAHSIGRGENLSWEQSRKEIPDRIKKTEVLMTIVDGKIVYRK
jgi:hypothetical protein